MPNSRVLETATVTAEQPPEPVRTKIARPMPAFVSIDDWTDLSGMGRRSTYIEIASGNLKAIKLGRKTLVDYQAGVAWLRTMPPAQIRPMQRKRAAA